MARKTGSAGVSDQGKGTGGVTREPERSRLCPHESNRHAERRVNNAPGLMTDLANVRSADGEHETPRHAESRGEAISRRTCAAGSRSGFIVPRKAGNRAHLDPLEGREPSRVKVH
jgi:hypothetical protein